MTTPEYKHDRVGMFINPHTRNRLNKLKAHLTLETGRIHSQDDAIVALLDHYQATAIKRDERTRELA